MDLTHLVLLMAAILFAAIVGVFFYWLGHHHGRRSVTHAPRHASVSHVPAPKAAPGAPEIPSYRIKELLTLLDLGILTQEEFDVEKGKLLAGRPA